MNFQLMRTSAVPLCFALIVLFAQAVPVCAKAQQTQTQDAQEAKSGAVESTPAQPTAPPDQISAVPNRPTFSSTAESVQPGVFEIEYGFELAEGHQNINGLLKFGASKNLELRFANNPIERDAAVSGFGDSGAGFKYKIFPQKGWRPTF